MIDYHGKLIESEADRNKRVKLFSEGLKEVFDSFDNANEINQSKISRGMHQMMKTLQNNTEEEYKILRFFIKNKKLSCAIVIGLMSSDYFQQALKNKKEVDNLYKMGSEIMSEISDKMHYKRLKK